MLLACAGILQSHALLNLLHLQSDVLALQIGEKQIATIFDYIFYADINEQIRHTLIKLVRLVI